MSVRPVRLKIRAEWFGFAPKGALTMRDWVEIADIVRRKKISKTDYDKVKGVMNEYIHDKR